MAAALNDVATGIVEYLNLDINVSLQWRLFMLSVPSQDELHLTQVLLNRGLSKGGAGDLGSTRRKREFFQALNSSNALTHFTYSAGSRLWDDELQILKNHPTITHLNLDFNFEEDPGYDSHLEGNFNKYAIIEILTQNRILKEFQFKIHHLDYDNIIPIAEALARITPNIKTIKFNIHARLNGCQHHYVIHLMKRALRDNHTLEKCIFSYSEVIRKEGLIYLGPINLDPIDICQEIIRDRQAEADYKERAERVALLDAGAGEMKAAAERLEVLMPDRDIHGDFALAQQLQAEYDAEARAEVEGDAAADEAPDADAAAAAAANYNWAPAGVLLPMFAGLLPAVAEEAALAPAPAMAAAGAAMVAAGAAAPRDAQPAAFSEEDVNLLLEAHDEAEKTGDLPTQLLISSFFCKHIRQSIAADPVTLNGRLYDRVGLNILLAKGEGQAIDPLERCNFTAKDIKPAWDIRTNMEACIEHLRKKKAPKQK